MPFKHAVFALFVLIVFGTSAIEIISEFAAGETLHAMGDDLARFALSAVVLALFVHSHVAQRQALGELRGQLNKARGQLAQIDATSQNLANQYRGVMQKQFDAWQLTASEQDVVIGLLKGLSFREIAEAVGASQPAVKVRAHRGYTKLRHAMRAAM